MNSLVRRAPIGASIADAGRFFTSYAADRSVTLFALVPVPGMDKRLGATARALLEPLVDEPRCRVRWEHSGLSLAPVEFEGCLWLEPDDHDEERAWLVLDGEYTWSGGADPLASLVVRRLTGAVARDLLARVGDFIEAGRARERAGNL